MTSAIRYDILDNKTGLVIASRKTRSAATKFADRKDLEYGAVRYIVSPVWA